MSLPGSSLGDIQKGSEASEMPPYIQQNSTFSSTRSSPTVALEAIPSIRGFPGALANSCSGGCYAGAGLLSYRTERSIQGSLGTVRADRDYTRKMDCEALNVMPGPHGALRFTWITLGF
jgi:hypothetical protein